MTSSPATAPVTRTTLTVVRPLPDGTPSTRPTDILHARSLPEDAPQSFLESVVGAVASAATEEVTSQREEEVFVLWNHDPVAPLIHVERSPCRWVPTVVWYPNGALSNERPDDVATSPHGWLDPRD